MKLAVRHRGDRWCVGRRRRLAHRRRLRRARLPHRRARRHVRARSRTRTPHSPDGARPRSARASAQSHQGHRRRRHPRRHRRVPDRARGPQGPRPERRLPGAADRDGDGIPDQFDKCPDVPEDKDGIDDQDGCPEDDADQDGIPDAKDACPKEPGQPDPDPKKNGCPKFIQLEGSSVRVLQQVHFATGVGHHPPRQLPDAQEIANAAEGEPEHQEDAIEGHTDNRGDADMNLDLSKRRAASVGQTWLIEHGIDAARLESARLRPDASRSTTTTPTRAAQANRRVEFKILEEDTRADEARRSSTTQARVRRRIARRPRASPRSSRSTPTPDAIEVAAEHVGAVRGAGPEGAVGERGGRGVGDVLARLRAGRGPAARRRSIGIAVADVVGELAGRAMRGACARAMASSRASRASGGTPGSARAASEHARERVVVVAVGPAGVRVLARRESLPLARRGARRRRRRVASSTGPRAAAPVGDDLHGELAGAVDGEASARRRRRRTSRERSRGAPLGPRTTTCAARAGTRTRARTRQPLARCGRGPAGARDRRARRPRRRRAPRRRRPRRPARRRSAAPLRAARWRATRRACRAAASWPPGRSASPRRAAQGCGSPAARWRQLDGVGRRHRRAGELPRDERARHAVEPRLAGAAARERRPLERVPRRAVGRDRRGALARPGERRVGPRGRRRPPATRASGPRQPRCLSPHSRPLEAPAAEGHVFAVRCSTVAERDPDPKAEQERGDDGESGSHAGMSPDSQERQLMVKLLLTENGLPRTPARARRGSAPRRTRPWAFPRTAGPRRSPTARPRSARRSRRRGPCRSARRPSCSPARPRRGREARLGLAHVERLVAATAAAAAGAAALPGAAPPAMAAASEFSLGAAAAAAGSPCGPRRPWRLRRGRRPPSARRRRPVRAGAAAEPRWPVLAAAQRVADGAAPARPPRSRCRRPTPPALALAAALSLSAASGLPRIIITAAPIAPRDDEHARRRGEDDDPAPLALGCGRRRRCPRGPCTP